MRILGVDPSLTATGYGVVDVVGNRVQALTYGVIRTNAKHPLPERLKKIYDGVRTVIEQDHPQYVSMEDVFYSSNIKVALKLGYARGAVFLAAANLGIPVAEYAPREIKQAITGIGSASKEQVQAMVQRLLRLSELPAPLDASDALAIALCHLFRNNFKLTL